MTSLPEFFHRVPPYGERADELAAALAGLTAEDRDCWTEQLGKNLLTPACAVSIPEDGGRIAVWVWTLAPIDPDRGNRFFHLSLPTMKFEPFHSHTGHNVSRIVAGAFDEIWRPVAWIDEGQITRRLRAADVIERCCDEGHHLSLPPGIPYALSIFEMGPPVAGQYIDRNVGPGSLR